MDKPFAITLDVGSSLASKTGTWRTARPVYVDRLPPCNDACPAGENIQVWLYHAEGGTYQAAWRALTEDNPLPAVMGRACDHPCEGACHRAQLDDAVGITAVERFLGDEAIKRGWGFAPPREESNKRVLVVGAGPSGLSAAYHLRRRGHRVTIAEAGPLAGGMMRVGIPEDQLPRDILDAEVQRIVDLGVELEFGHKVSNILDAMRAGRFDAAFLAVGAHSADPSLLDGVPGVTIGDDAVEVEANLMTGHAGVFAAGDVVPSERTITVAVGHGKKAARHIDAWLRGGAYEPAPKHESATFEHLNTWYYADAPKTVRPGLDIARRTSTLAEAVAGLDASNALFEARRCLSCGNCFECDNCYGVCPDNAVVKPGPGGRYQFNYDYCKGCGICVSECPCGAIRMVPETI